jgi:superfamily II DNA or RNA helicase
MAAFKSRTKGLLFQFRDEVKEVMLPVVFGRVISHWRELNPQQNPTVLFAPGVEESIWFTEQFTSRGVPWSHIDGTRILLNGYSMAANRDNRDALWRALRSGETKGVSNRFVLREGIDLPEVAHCIFACTFGSTTAYLQAGGRALRAHPSLTEVLIQDHGGNFYRHDSLNMDRQWSLEDTDKTIREKHAEKYRTKAEPEPVVCPQCSFVRKHGVSCPKCGFTYHGRRRRVIEVDGTLREVHGEVYRPRRLDQRSTEEKDWVGTYFRCRKTGKTFSQARGLYAREHEGKYPNPEWSFMPQSEADWGQRVGDVPYNRLTSARCYHEDVPKSFTEPSMFD